MIGWQSPRHFLDQGKAKTIVSWSHAFSRAFHRLHVFASNSDWYIALFPSVVIGQSNIFGFDFTTLNRKPKLMLRELRVPRQVFYEDLFRHNYQSNCKQHKLNLVSVDDNKAFANINYNIQLGAPGRA